MNSIDCAYLPATGSTVEQTPRNDWRLVVASPAEVDMASIVLLAQALDDNVGHLAKTIYQSPAVLARGLTDQQQADLGEACAVIGLDVYGERDDEPFEDDPERFDLAVLIVSPQVIPHAVEVLAAVVGVGSSDAYQMLATPPGLIVGDVSRAAVAALKLRFGPGIEVSVAAAGVGPFDAWVDPSVPNSPILTRLFGTARALVRLGLDHNAAKKTLDRCPRGSVRLIARDLIRCDVVLTGGDEQPNEQATDWLVDHFGVERDQVAVLMQHLPIALAEGATYEEAERYHSDAGRLGLSIALEPAGFGRFAVTVVHAHDRRALAAVLEDFELPVPGTFPAVVATELSDLDARWLGYQLELAGAAISFEGCR